MMNTRISPDRRDFLRLGAALCAGAWACCARGVSAAGGRGAFPVTVRDALLRATGRPDCWSAFRDVGADGIEANVGIDMALVGMFHPAARYSLAAPDDIAAFRDAAAMSRASVLTFMMANRFDSRLDEEIAWMKRLVAACRPLGARTIRIDLVPQKLSRAEFLPFAIRVGKEISRIAADGGVRLAIENHGSTTNDPAFLERLFAGVGADNLGLTLDTANFYWYGHPLNDLYGLFEKFAPRAFHVHCKSIRYPEAVKNARREMGWQYREHACPIHEGDIDFARVVKILREAGYAGDLCLEDESLHHYPGEQRLRIIRQQIAHLRRLA